MKTVLILGASGMLGSEIARNFCHSHNVFCHVRRRDLINLMSRCCSVPREKCVHLDLNPSSIGHLSNIVRDLRPDFVLNCVGVVKQHETLCKRDESIFINSYFPQFLSRIAIDLSFNLVHFSTDCVFSGRSGPYREIDVPDPGDFYGCTKALGEVDSRNCLTLRSSIVGFSMDGTNRGLFDWFLANKGSRITGYASALYSGVTTLEMAKVVSLIVDRFESLTGVWQVSGDAIDKASLLSLLNESMDLGIEIKRDSSFVCDRRLNSDRFREATGWKPPSWKTMIDELVARKKITDAILEAHS